MKKIFKVQFTTKLQRLFLFEDFIDNFNCNYFIDKINQNLSDKLSFKTNVKNEMTDFTFFVNDSELLKILKSYEEQLSLLKLEPMRLCDCWGTKSCDTVETTKHEHGQGLSGIIYLTQGGPGTFFPQFNYNVEEAVGKIVFFDSQVSHEVKKTTLKTNRYLLSFNFKRLRPWEHDEKF